MFPPKCGRRSPRRRGRCTVTRHRAASGRYLPACMAHLTRDERIELGLFPGIARRARADAGVDIAKLRAGDRD